MDWTDRGIVLARRKHGESAAIVTLLTHEHGRHAGLVRGGAGKRASSVWQSGNLVSAHWRARLAEHLGTLTGELTEAFAARALDEPLKLAAVASACAVLEAVLPEREPHPSLFETTLDLLAAIDRRERAEEWGVGYVNWELQCLTELGFGLDLQSCAVTGVTDNLAYVSPRSGRAVSTETGAAYADRLFALPGFLRGEGGGDKAGVLAGLRLTGHFLERHVLAPHERRVPAARTRFIDRWRRLSTIAGNS
jgi:DNA repair protein RecO (recombination protein O)